MKREDLFLAENLIASKRLQLDEKVSKVKGVQFFFSAVGGVTTNPTKQSKKQEKTLTKNEETNEENKAMEEVDQTESTNENGSVEDKKEEMIYPAVSYFVVYKKGCQDTASSIHKALHEAGTEVEVKELRTKKKSQGEEKELLSKLCQVLKDHNSTYALGRLKDSVDFCYEQAISNNLEGADDAEKRRLFPHADDTSLKALKVPTRLCVTDMEEYGIEIAAAISNLSRDGLQCTF